MCETSHGPQKQGNPMQPADAPDIFAHFADTLRGSDMLESLRDGLIGEGIPCPGPSGPHPLIYADYVASGRALRQIEDLMMTEVLPLYSNAHTEASWCGRAMNRLRAQARAIVATHCGATPEHAVIFAGSGATAGLTRLVGLLGVEDMVRAGQRPVVLIGPYEHHSNILPWRESGAEVIEIPEAATGGPDPVQLQARLTAAAGRPVIGAFSAASNVTGIVSDVKGITRILKAQGAISVWDYAGAAPYLPIDMGIGMDAVVLSPHKFIGGPGASGLLILRRDAVTRARPTAPGGGTVRYVSPWGHDYAQDVAVREEAGTPNVLGDIRAALCYLVKDAIGPETMEQRLGDLGRRARAAWADTPGLHILGTPEAQHRLPIFSFQILDPAGRVVHPQLVTRILSDHFGIQARGGCACAGPYAHRLLELDQARSDTLRDAILGGEEMQKPGWTRLAFSVLMDDAKADRIISAVNRVATDPSAFGAGYRGDSRTARFIPQVESNCASIPPEVAPACHSQQN